MLLMWVAMNAPSLLNKGLIGLANKPALWQGEDRLELIFPLSNGSGVSIPSTTYYKGINLVTKGIIKEM